MLNRSGPRKSRPSLEMGGFDRLATERRRLRDCLGPVASNRCVSRPYFEPRRRTNPIPSNPAPISSSEAGSGTWETTLSSRLICATPAVVPTEVATSSTINRSVYVHEPGPTRHGRSARLILRPLPVRIVVKSTVPGVQPCVVQISRVSATDPLPVAAELLDSSKSSIRKAPPFTTTSNSSSTSLLQDDARLGRAGAEERDGCRHRGGGKRCL